MIRYFTVLGLAFLIFGSAIASGQYTLKFRAIEHNPSVVTNFSEAAPDNSELVNGHFYRVLQFYAIPSNEDKKALEEKGLKFIYYQPYNAYYVALPLDFNLQDLNNYNVRSIFSLDPSWKFNKRFSPLNIPANADLGNGFFEIIVDIPTDLNRSDIANRLSQLGYQVVDGDETGQALNLYVSSNELQGLSLLPYVYFIDFPSEPGVPENNTARTLHRSNSISPDYGAGRNYDGSGVRLQIQDSFSPTTHADNKGRFDRSANGGQSGQSHGDHVSGTVQGAGNLDPDAEGMAKGAFSYIYNGSNANYAAVPGLVANQGVVITQKSFSNGCNDGYTSLARDLDVYVDNAPQLLHVFSAGNSNGSTCGGNNYGAGNQWGNITGGHKVAKSSIATANVTINGTISGSSSRGPAEDGRIKPDLSAKGTQVLSTYPNNGYASISGTSMASPGVAGVSAQLYQAYRENNGGANPNAGLIKGIMLNTANELGNPGPDFIYGWGLVNGIRSLEAIENNLYFSDSVSQGDSLVFNLNVPAGTVNMRVMVYWPDRAGSINASPALVNDLDFSIFDPSSGEFLPWVLDHTPNPAALASPATRGIDRLNNMEQVTIENPAPGNYTLVVKGHAIPVGPQEFFVTHYFETDDIKLTYPIGGEMLEPNENILFRWDAYGNTGNFDLEYSIDSGSNWTNISSVGGSQRQFAWGGVPSFTPNAMVRITRGSSVSTTETVFSVIERPDNLSFSSICPDSVELSWNSVFGAGSYEVYRLGTMYMDSIAVTTTTSAWIPADINQSNDWFTVRALGITHGRSQRAFAIEKPMAALNCPEAPLVDFSSAEENICVGKPVQLFDESINQTSGWKWTFSPNLVTYENGTSDSSQNPIVSFGLVGNYTVTLEASNNQGSNSATKNSFISVGTGDPTPINEDFQAVAFPPQNWEIHNPDNDFGWERRFPAVTGWNGVPTFTAWMDNFNNNVNFREDGLDTRIMDISNFNQPLLVFHIAHAQRVSTLSSSVRVDYSTDCGESFFPTLYNKTGQDLATVPTMEGSAWQPTSFDHWRQDTIDLTAYKGKEVQIRFVNISRVVANNTYIDNVRVIEGSATSLETPEVFRNFNYYPNPTNGRLTLNFGSTPQERTQFIISDAIGKSVYSDQLQEAVTLIELPKLPSGIYFMTLTQGDSEITRKLVIE